MFTQKISQITADGRTPMNAIDTNTAESTGTDTAFEANIWAMNGFPSYFITEGLSPTSNPDVMGRFDSINLQSDSDPGTWEKIAVTCTIPRGPTTWRFAF